MAHEQQLTALVILSNGHHLCVNNNGKPWAVFSKALLQAVLDRLIAATEPGVHVIAACIAHNDHFHAVESQEQLFKALSASELDIAAARASTELKGRTCH